MNDFKQFFEATRAKNGFRLNVGDIVIVKDRSSHGSSIIPRKYSHYVNKIGIVKGRVPRSMASPYYIIEMDDGTETKIVGVFLRGPYRDMETAKKYKANPSLEDDPSDIVYSQKPIDPIIKPPSSTIFERDEKTENTIKQNFPSFVWLETEEPYGPRNASNIGFIVAKQVIRLHNKKQNVYILRYNHAADGKIYFYAFSNTPVFFVYSKFLNSNALNIDEIREHITDPFVKSNSYVTFLDRGDNLSNSFSVIQVKNNINLYGEFSRLQKLGNKGICDFYLNENGMLQTFLKTAENTSLHSVFGVYNYSPFQRKLFNALVKQVLIEQGILADNKLNISDHINLFVSDIK